MAATKPLTTEAIALTERKMDMTLDDIIKMSKKTTANKEKRPSRRPIKSQGFLNGSARRNTVVERFMDTRSSIRLGVLAQRRSNFRENQFPATASAARKAAAMPIRSVMVNRNKPRVTPAPSQRKAADPGSAGKDKMILKKQRPQQTMDALFANMKQQRMRVFSAQPQTARANSRRTSQRRRAQKKQRQRGGAARGHRFGNSAE